jgi:hypothetical protein
MSNTKKVVMKFKDAPIGARFYYPNDETKNIWVKLNAYPPSSHSDGFGLICMWYGNIKTHQPFCAFVDEENGINLDTEIELT